MEHDLQPQKDPENHEEIWHCLSSQEAESLQKDRQSNEGAPGCSKPIKPGIQAGNPWEGVTDRHHLFAI